MRWYIEAFKKYAVFSGRASRKEYWMFILLNFIVSSCICLLDIYFDLKIGNIYDQNLYLLTSVYNLIVFLPSLAIMIRRLHDVNRNGLNILGLWVPFLNIPWAFYILYLLLKAGDPGDNNYGPKPETT